jgi:hypothetical protein
LFKGSNSTPIYIPPLSVKLLCGVWPILVGLARDLPFFPGLLHGFVQLLAQRLERPLPALQITSISALLAMDFSVTCGACS